MHLDGIDNAGYMTHDNNTTTWQDLTGNGYHATLVNGASWDEDSFVTSIDKSNYANLKTQLLNCRTLEVVMKIDETYNTNYHEACVIGLINGYFGMMVQMEHTIYFTGTNRYNISPADLSYSTPFSVSAICGNDLQTLTGWAAYYNGTEYAVNRYTTAIGNLSLRIVSRNDRRFDGNVYAVRAYDRVLTPSEIAHNYNIDKIRFGL